MKMIRKSKVSIPRSLFWTNNNTSSEPLYEVCTSGNVEAARILLEAGADIHATDVSIISFSTDFANSGTFSCKVLLHCMQLRLVATPKPASY
jgi:hypothetical protein